MIDSTALKLKISPEKLIEELEAGESILDNPSAVDSYLKATGQQLVDFERECFDDTADRIRRLSSPHEEMPDSLKKKWSQPLG